MAGFDDLIRDALKKQGNPTSDQRQAIYQSSRQALERMIEKNDILDAAAVTAQHERLEAAIASVESDYSSSKDVETPEPQKPAPSAPPPQPQQNVPPAAETPEPDIPEVAEPVPPKPAPEPEPEPAAAPKPKSKLAPPPQPKLKPAAPVEQAVPVEPVAAPAAKVPTVETPQPAPEVDIPAPASVEAPGNLEPQNNTGMELEAVETYKETYKGDAFRERKPYAKLLLWTIILVGIAVAAWWAITFGPAFLQERFDESVPNPSTTIESGSFVPNETEGWISAFDPQEDAQNVEATNRGSADLMINSDTKFVRIASNPGGTQNNVRIKMPKGVMQSLKGKSATFEVTVKSSDKSAHEFAIFCEFGAMGSCGRKRFKAAEKLEVFIYYALINDASLPEGQDAYLDINTDLSNSGKSIDLYSVRVRPG